MDASEVVPRLYQGGAVVPGHSYDAFSLIILCAQEHQPVLPHFRGQLLRPAFDDTTTPSSGEVGRAQVAARHVVREYRRNLQGNILVTCAMGWNRSGLVTALALTQLTGWSTGQIIDVIRRARGPNAMSNPAFCGILHANNRNERAPVRR